MYAMIATWRMALDGVSRGKEMLADGSCAADALESAIRMVEEREEYTSVGYGGLPNAQMQVELDAGFMDGDSLSIGAVGGIHDFASPFAIARRLSREPLNNFLVGSGAEPMRTNMALPVATCSVRRHGRVICVSGRNSRCRRMRGMIRCA